MGPACRKAANNSQQGRGMPMAVSMYLCASNKVRDSGTFPHLISLSSISHRLGSQETALPFRNRIRVSKCRPPPGSVSYESVQSDFGSFSCVYLKGLVLGPAASAGNCIIKARALALINAFDFPSLISALPLSIMCLLHHHHHHHHHTAAQRCCSQHNYPRDSAAAIIISAPMDANSSGPQCCHCGWRGDHEPNCPFKIPTRGVCTLFSVSIGVSDACIMSSSLLAMIDPTPPHRYPHAIYPRRRR